MNQLPAATLLGQNVRRLCEMQGMSLDALAERLGWPGEKVADLLASSLDIALDQVDELSAALGVAPHELFDEVTMAENQTQQLRYG
ncbi:helix-turn-helix domain-containing protein [Devosia riboflavina]|uniref:helix-turn-helix domain-containing protein n=1 Tax=Devosia riboflavina TaxID=46914 RepID=UPI0005527075|nr:helix-turn-helix transcriptional regulator [Devosia riboflavina]